LETKRAVMDYSELKPGTRAMLEAIRTEVFDVGAPAPGP